MVNYFKALALALFLCITNVNAAYTQANPPTGWTGGTGPGGFWDTGSKNTVSFSSNGKVLIRNATVNVGGRSVALNAALKLSQNAPKVAAATLFANPGLAAGIRVAGWLAAASLVYNVSTGLWEGTDSENPVSDGYKYCHNSSIASFCGDTLSQVINDALRFYPGSPTYAGGSWFNYGQYVSHRLDDWGGSYRLIVVNYRSNRNYENAVTISRSGVSDCPPGNYFLPSGECTDNIKRVFDETRFIEEITKNPMPYEVPEEVPARYPVELPEIEPAFSPSGNPKPNPEYDPVKGPSKDNLPWIQQGVKLEPSPTLNEPWRIDVRPVDRPVPGPEPSPDDVIPEPKPDDGTNPDDRPQDKESPPDLCEKHPDILACQIVKMGEPEKPEALREIPIDATFQIEGGFNSGGSCPGFPSVSTLPGGQISWQPFCDSLVMVRPLILAFAWFSAIFIILKYGRR